MRRDVSAASRVDSQQRLQLIKQAYAKAGTGLEALVDRAQGRAQAPSHGAYEFYSSLFEALDDIEKMRSAFPSSFAARMNGGEAQELEAALKGFDSPELAPLKDVLVNGTPEAKAELKQVLSQGDEELRAAFKDVGAQILDEVKQTDHFKLADALAKDLGFKPDAAERAELAKMFEEQNALAVQQVEQIRANPEALNGLDMMTEIAQQARIGLRVMEELKAQLQGAAAK